MAKLSRECIRDTLLAKRQCRGQLTGFIRQVYNLGICNLRAGQLAPYVETKMLPNRYLDMQTVKRAAPDIVITVRGGLVQEVRSSNPYTRIYLADYDIRHDDPDEEACLSEAEERGIAPDMHIVY